MAVSKTDVMNLALFKLAQDQTIPSISDQSKHARVMNRLWDPTLDLVLSDGVWPWATTFAKLPLSINPETAGWAYRYSRPNDCLTAWAVTNQDGLRSMRTQGGLVGFCGGPWSGTVAPFAGDFEPIAGDNETEILTDVREAYLVYTKRITDTGRFQAHFVDTLASRLAADAAGAIIGEVGLNAKPRLMQEYVLSRSQAAAHDYNESRNTQETATPALAARW